MLPIRLAALQARTAVMRPWRNALLRQMAAAGKAPISALFYHRVADTLPNDWTISCDQFERHVEYCRQNFDVISLAELQHRCATQTSVRPAVSFTFDDGYAENCRFALPLLMRHQVPCTYFVTVDNLLTGRPFEHDLRAGRPLPTNTVDEVRAMSDGGIEIGLHTQTHLDLAGVTSRRILRREITDAAARLADLVGRPIRFFAFPFGLPKQLTPQAIETVHEAGLAGFCSAYGAYNLPGQDVFHIRRIHGDCQWARLENWLTFDRAKLRRQPTIAYSLPQPQPQPAREAVTATAATAAKTRPLRTLFVITSMPVGGAETLLVNLIDRLDRRRILPEVVCLKEPGPLGEAIRARHAVHSDLTAGKWDIRVLPRLMGLIRRRQIDAVITVGAGDKMFWGRLAARLSGVPVICSALHSTGWPDGVSRLNRALTPITDAFIAVADHHAAHLKQSLRLEDGRVRMIRNGIDCQRFAPSSAAKKRLLGELSLPSQTQLVGIVAALRPEKNHAMFLDVAASLLHRNERVHFLIVGDGPQRASIERRIGGSALEGRVHLLGTRHDTPDVVAALDLFLLCSHNEASPVSILESLACGVPVVSTDVGSVSEMVRPGETGFLVAPGDASAMATSVETLLGNTQLRASLGLAGRQAVTARGSLGAMVEGYTELIESIYLQKTRGRSAEKTRGQLTELVSTKSALPVDLSSSAGCNSPLDSAR